MTCSFVGKLGLVLLMIFGPASLASAHDATTSNSNCVPARIGNIWGGYAHEPQPAVVERQEQKAGVALSPNAARSLDREVELRAQKLLHSAAQGRAAHWPAPPDYASRPRLFSLAPLYLLPNSRLNIHQLLLLAL